MTLEEAYAECMKPVVDEVAATQVVETYIEWKKGVKVTIQDLRSIPKQGNPITIMKYQQELGKLMKAYEIASNAIIKHHTNG